MRFAAMEILWKVLAQKLLLLPGILKLGNLIYLYDDNKITIEGDTSTCI